MIALRFYATGTFQLVIGDLLGVSKATVHNCIRRVSNAIVSHLANYVAFDDVRGTTRTKQQFHSMAGFPNVIDCIDCTHVKVIALSRNEYEYVNRKGYHSVNVQLICDADLKILNFVVKWPGSVHDARIVRESSVFPAFEAVPPLRDGCLLGDGGYMLRPWLLTPHLNADNRAQQSYNFAQSSTRTTIERCNGVLKRRWHSLHGELRYVFWMIMQCICICFVGLLIWNINFAVLILMGIGHDTQNLDWHTKFLTHALPVWSHIMYWTASFVFTIVTHC